MPTRTFPEQIGDWKILNENLKARLSEIPLLAPLHAELEEQIAEAERLESEQEVHKMRLRITNEKRTEVEVRGRNLRSRLTSMLRGQFGSKSNELLQFGVKPRATARRRKPEAAPAAAPEPQPAPAATAGT